MTEEANGADDDADQGDGDDEGDEADGDRDWDAGYDRVEEILGKGEREFSEDVEVFCAHLQKHLQLPCEVTGIEDFQWEEPYIIGGWSQREYRQLKKTQPSYRDRYQLLAINTEGDAERMMHHDGIAAHVRRISDGKQFILGLSELEATDRHSPNYQLLDDYSVWFVNAR